MAKNSVSDWDTTANNNTDVGGINIAENCPAANVNNAMREIMAQVADYSAAVPLGARDATNAALAAAYSDGTIVLMDGLFYEVDSSATGTDSATNDLSVDGLKPASPIASLAHFGTPADPTSSTAHIDAAEAFCTANGLRLLVPAGDYNYDSTTYTVPADSMWIPGNFDGGVDLIGSVAKARLFITTESDDSAAYDANLQATCISLTTWAQGNQHGNGIRTNLKNTSTFSGGNTGLYAYSTSSGSAAWTAASHAEHFHETGTGFGLNVEMATYSTSNTVAGINVLNRTASVSTHPVTGTAAAEHPDIPALRIDGDRSTSDQSTWKYGIRIISDAIRADGTSMRFDSPVTQHMQVATSAPASAADILLQADSATGIALEGNYTGSAIRLEGGEKISMESTGSIAMKYDATVWGFFSGASERIGLQMSGAGPGVRVNGTQVLGTQKVAVADVATGGSASASANATAINSILNRLRLHGLIAT